MELLLTAWGISTDFTNYALLIFPSNLLLDSLRIIPIYARIILSLWESIVIRI